MRTEIIGNKKVKLYDGIDELPVVRFQKFTKFLLIDAGVGETFEAVDARLNRALLYIGRDDKKNAVEELKNLRQTMYFVYENISPGMMSFALFVKSVDDQDRDDITDTGLAETASLFKDDKQSSIHEILDELKKKIDEDLNIYFEELFAGDGEKEYYSLMREYGLAVCESITNPGDEIENKARELKEKLLLFYPPSPFTGDESIEVRQDKEFELSCLLIQKETNSKDPKTMSVFEFYTAISYIRAERKREKQKQARIKTKR